MGSRLVDLRPVHGFAAETAAGTVIEIATRVGMPISTTHAISSAIMGVGAVTSLKRVRWTVAGNILAAWIFTIPACLILGWVLMAILRAGASATGLAAVLP